MSVTLYIGPMFSGKTTALVSKYVEGDTMSFKHTADDRYGYNSRIITHGGLSVPAKQVSVVPLVVACKRVVLIDEGQFFCNIREAALHYARCGSDVYITALSGTSELGAWGNVSDLIPICDDVVHLKAPLCMRCRARPAPFTATKVGITKSGEVKVGGAETYEPVCRNCH